jgi:hypothetical protein
MPDPQPGCKVSAQPQVCTHCKGEFRGYRLRKYCSPKCYHAARSAAVPTAQCPACGQPFRAIHNGTGMRRFCSKACTLKYLSGENHPNWTGGRSIDSSGYVRVNVGHGKREREHRLVASGLLGQTPESGQVVHHKNGDKTDNRPENLEVLGSSEHTRLHQRGRPQSPPIVCLRCGRMRKHRAKGLCHSCYSLSNLEARMAADPIGTRERLLESKRRSYARRKGQDR